MGHLYLKILRRWDGKKLADVSQPILLCQFALSRYYFASTTCGNNVMYLLSETSWSVTAVNGFKHFFFELYMVIIK